MKTQVIIPAAGSGTRLGASIPKALVLLKKKPLMVYALEVFERLEFIHSVILVVPGRDQKRFRKVVDRYRLKKVKRIVAGGATRSASVSNGLKVLDANTDVVVIHDAARPFLVPKTLKDSVLLMKNQKAAIIAVPVKPTIKQVNTKTGTVIRTLDRNELWEAQTPQVFRKAILVKAHQKAGKTGATDDAMLVERMGVRVKVVPGDYRNIKITTKEDVALAESFLKVRSK